MAPDRSIFAHYALRERCHMPIADVIHTQNDIGVVEKLIGSFSVLRLTLPMSMPSERFSWLSET
jgi:hypothetical protein